MKTLKVLSIDMDFFQNVDYDTIIECYPDGHDYSAMLSAIVWASHYSNSNEAKRLNDVTCPDESLKTLKHILGRQLQSTPVFISQSHLDIYKFIHDKLKLHHAKFLEVVNIDMHHDMFTDNVDTVDCGNWAHHIRQEVPTRFTWISHDISEEAMDYSVIQDLDEVNIVKNDFKCIEDIRFDLIFLCRSDAWYPPHLDDKFNELVECLCNFYNVKVSDRLVSRDSVNFQTKHLQQIYDRVVEDAAKEQLESEVAV